MRIIICTLCGCVLINILVYFSVPSLLAVVTAWIITQCIWVATVITIGHKIYKWFEDWLERANEVQNRRSPQ